MGMFLLSASLFACSSPQPASGCPECAPCPEPASTLQPWEQQVLAQDLADIRLGVRPIEREGSFGVCKGTTECDAFLGADPGELTEGEHMILAELAVPAAGEGWGAVFDITCQVVTTAGRETVVEQSKPYELVHTGPQRGYLLKPLWRIQSPHPQGSRDCLYSLTPVRPDGSHGEAVTGHYFTAMPQE